MLVGRSRQEAVRKEGGTEVGDFPGQPPWEDAVAARVIEGIRTIFWLPEQPHRRLKLDVVLQGVTIVGTFVGLGLEDIPVSRGSPAFCEGEVEGLWVPLTLILLVHNGRDQVQIS